MTIATTVDSALAEALYRLKALEMGRATVKDVEEAIWAAARLLAEERRYKPIGGPYIGDR